MKYVIAVEGETFEIEMGQGGRVWVNRRPLEVDFRGGDGRPQYSLLVDHRSYDAALERAGDGEYYVQVSGRSYRAELMGRGPFRPAARRRQRSLSGRCEVRAPLPGLLVEVPVAVGQRVAAGDVVAVLESMKMNLELRSPRDGKVRSLAAVPGDEVEQGAVLAVVG